MKAIRLPGTVTVGLFVLASAAGCTIQSGTVQLLPDSGIYGQAWSRGESGARYSKLASRGRYFNVESPDRRILVRTIVIADDGSFKAKLDPAYYFIDTGDPNPIHALVHVRTGEFVRTDLVLADKDEDGNPMTAEAPKLSQEPQQRISVR